MQLDATTIPEVKLITSNRFGDGRAFFSEVYSRKAWEQAGLDCGFVQNNHSYSAEAGVVRGLHFQLAPFEQAKQVRVARAHPWCRRRLACGLADLRRPCRRRAVGGRLKRDCGIALPDRRWPLNPVVERLLAAEA